MMWDAVFIVQQIEVPSSKWLLYFIGEYEQVSRQLWSDVANVNGQWDSSEPWFQDFTTIPALARRK
jgi:hypothetical protein